MDIHGFWRDVLSQNREALPAYFREDAVIRWHCTNEVFTVGEYVRANCDYPGAWDGEIERIEALEGIVVLAGRVFPRGGGAASHVVSFIRLADGKISELDEYWADDGDPPDWRGAMGIGRPIR